MKSIFLIALNLVFLGCSAKRQNSDVNQGTVIKKADKFKVGDEIKFSSEKSGILKSNYLQPIVNFVEKDQMPKSEQGLAFSLLPTEKPNPIVGHWWGHPTGFMDAFLVYRDIKDFEKGDEVKINQGESYEILDFKISENRYYVTMPLKNKQSSGSLELFILAATYRTKSDSNGKPYTYEGEFVKLNDQQVKEYLFKQLPHIGIGIISKE